MKTKISVEKPYSQYGAREKLGRICDDFLMLFFFCVECHFTGLVCNKFNIFFCHICNEIINFASLIWDEISDKISADKIAENLTCCRKFCLPKILSAEIFCPRKSLTCQINTNLPRQISAKILDFFFLKIYRRSQRRLYTQVICAARYYTRPTWFSMTSAPISGLLSALYE